MNDSGRYLRGKQMNREGTTHMTKQNNQSDESVDCEALGEEMERLKDISHTPPVGQGANRVWDGTRVFDGDNEDDE